MIARFWFALCLTLAAGASDAATAEKLATHAELVQTQEQVQKLENALAVHQGTLQTRFDANDKRISDFGVLVTMQGTHSTWVGNLVAISSIAITVLVFGAGLVTFLGATARAKTEAREAAQEWFKVETTRLRGTIRTLEHEVETARAAVVKVQQDAEIEFSKQTGDVIDKAKTITNQMDNVMRTFSERGVVEPATATLVREASEELRTRPESAYSANDHYIRGVTLYASRKRQSALDAFDEAIKLGVTEQPNDQVMYQFAKGVALGGLGKPQEAIAAYDAIDGRYGKDEAPGMREHVAGVLINKGVMLGGLGKPDEEIAVYDAIDGRYGKDEAPGTRERVAKALFNKGITLGGLGKPDEEIAVYDAIDGRYGKDEAPGTREQVAMALVNKGITLDGLGKPEEAIAAYDAVDGRYGKDEAPGMRELVARALVNKGITLGGLGKPDEEIAVYDAIDGRYGKDEAPGMREQVADALNGLGYEKIMLAKKHWADEVRRIALLDEARLSLERALASCRSDMRAIVAGNIGYGHFLAGRLEEARRYTLECLQLDGQEALARQRLDAQLLRVHPEDLHYEQLLDAL